jgi:hypothetical protein
MMEAQIVGGLGHQGIERRIAGEDTPSVRSFSRSSNRPPSEDWLPPLKSTVIFLRQTDGVEGKQRIVGHGGCGRQMHIAIRRTHQFAT